MASIYPQPKMQFFTNNGDPAVGYKLYTYEPGSAFSVLKTTYSDDAGTPNANPIVMDARGEASVFWDGEYDVKLETDTGALVWTQAGVGLAGLVITDGGVSTTITDALSRRRVAFASMEALRLSTTNYDDVETDSFYDGGNKGGARLYRSGAGTPTGSGASVIAAALAAGTFCNAAGICYKLSLDTRTNPYIFGANGDYTDDTPYLVPMCAYIMSLGSIMPHKYVDWMGGNFGITAAGGLITAEGLKLDNTDGIHFLGWGATLKRLDAPGNSNRKPMTVTNCDGFSMSGLSVDINGCLFFGGFSIYDSNRVKLSKCYFFDSAPGAVTADRYALFVGGSTPTSICDDFSMEGCTVTGLQTEFIATSGSINGNHFTTNVNRAIGIVTGGTSALRGILSVTGNTFESAKDDCITIGVDPTAGTNGILKGIVISDNVYRSDVVSGGHFVSVSAIGASNLVTTITISDNEMYDTVGNPFVKMDSSNNSTFVFNSNISNNTYVTSAATAAGPIYNLRRLDGGEISGNKAIGAGITQAFKFERTARLAIHDNEGEATSIAFEINNTFNSTTGYQTFYNNRWRGAPTTKLYIPGGLNVSDVVEMMPGDFSDVVIVGANQVVNVAGIKNIRITAVAAASVATLTNAYYGKEITLYFDNGNVTINNGAAANNARLAGAVNFVGTANDTLSLIYHTDGTWREKSRAII